MRRRTFLTFAVGLPFSGVARAWLPARGATLVIYDDTLPASAAFARAAAGRGVTLRALEGDPFRFAQALSRDLRGRAVPIAAMTDYSDYLLLTGSLNEAGYRVTGEAFHQLRDPLPHHRCTGAWAALETPLARCGLQWPDAIAKMATGTGASSALPVSGQQRRSPHLLVSWALHLREDLP